MVDHGSQCGQKSPEASFVDESEEEGDMGDIDNEEKENGNLHVADSIPNRAITSWCDSVSLNDFGLITTFETDYTLEVIQHLILTF